MARNALYHFHPAESVSDYFDSVEIKEALTGYITAPVNIIERALEKGFGVTRATHIINRLT